MALIDPEDPRLTPRERALLRTIGHNIAARRDGRPDLTERLPEHRGRPAPELPAEHREALERAFGPTGEEGTPTEVMHFPPEVPGAFVPGALPFGTGEKDSSE